MYSNPIFCHQKSKLKSISRWGRRPFSHSWSSHLVSAQIPWSCLDFLCILVTYLSIFYLSVFPKYLYFLFIHSIWGLSQLIMQFFQQHRPQKQRCFSLLNQFSGSLSGKVLCSVYIGSFKVRSRCLFQNSNFHFFSN